ncbi:AIPR family protein [uncultured Granulicatella sp.]|uniref:AIPR family protein n=1 Tax=uncultured Granulicatella sp. TaxID=316089 RepID=UPI0028D3382C|nr:AIPR family protein [uncultured Granulicatella sp.]
MATINDFKLVNLYSTELLKRIYSISQLNKLSESNQKRFGFYYLILQLTTGNTATDELERMIIDTDYCKSILGVDNNDFGIDAVYIDEDDKRIVLYNFKFRESFSSKKGGKQGPVLDSTKFLSMSLNGSFKDVDDSSSISKEKMEAIYEKIISDEIWNIELIVVSNENQSVDINQPEINSLKRDYDVDIRPIVLDDIIGFLHNRNNEFSAKFIVDKESFLVYEEDSLSSAKSYLVKISVADLIRMTCSDKEQRDNYNYDTLEMIKDLKLEIGILYENVRGYLSNSKYNKNIIKTLSECPNKFFVYNNGITITAKNVKAEPKNANKKYLFTLDNMQIVNGGQTLRSIYKFKEKEFDEEKLENSSVLVRIFKTEDNDELINEIAEYTNSQNSISDADLKSINKIQIKIEKFLFTQGIDYIRKSGDIGINNKLKSQIGKETLAQILYSYKGYPDRATNQKKKLFGIYYDEIFGEDVIEFDKLLELIKLYDKIETKYKELYGANEVYTQKVLYIIYLQSIRDDIETNIHLLERTLDTYRKDDDISKARKLIQKGFKEFLDTSLKTGTGTGTGKKI